MFMAIKAAATVKRIVAVLGYLGVNYAQATLDETARFFGYSTSYLSRFIKNSTGKTYSQIVTTLQMEQAVSRMKAGRTNLAEIAQDAYVANY